MTMDQRLLRVKRSAFNPLSLSPALWLKADAGLITDGAAQFTAANSESLSKASVAQPSEFSFSGWVYRDTASAGDVAVFQNKGVLIGFGNSNTLDWYPNTSTTVLQAASGFTTASWHHLAVTQDAAGNYVMYVDGVSVKNGSTVAINTSTSQDLCLGRYAADQRYFNGRMDSCAYWSRAITPAEVTSLYNSGSGKTYNDLTTAEKVSLVSWWNLNEISGTRYDSHGTNHLTDNNTVTYAAGVASGLALADGDPVTTWQDQSGNGRHATQATASKRPTLKLAIQNGRNVVRSDGVDDVLKTAAFTFNQPSVAIIVAKWTSGSNFIDGLSVNTRGLEKNGANALVYAGAAFTTAMNWTPWHVMYAVWNGASSKFAYDGGADATGNVGTAAASGLTAFNNGDESFPCACDIGELIMLTAEPSAANRAALFSYLNSRWGVY